ncbi:MAG: hypothetical protein H7Z39_06860 [Burkholderiaceae bacterium]|nr:hypothetical protein [Burkholderiaceae bacterium]
MTAPTNPGKTPFFNFLAFFVAFGWEGPVVINIGLENHSYLEIGMGLFFLVVFWGLFGVRLLYALIRHVLGLPDAPKVVAAAAKPPTAEGR